MVMQGSEGKVYFKAQQMVSNEASLARC